MKKYYIVYLGEYDSGPRIGRCTHITDKKIKTYKDIVEAEESVKRQFQLKNAIILNYKRIKL